MQYVSWGDLKHNIVKLEDVQTTARPVVRLERGGDHTGRRGIGSRQNPDTRTEVDDKIAREPPSRVRGMAYATPST
jgi:hypothetical protein